MTTIPAKTSPDQRAPYWQPAPGGVLLACENGHLRPVMASLIDADGRVAESMQFTTKKGRVCNGSLRCPREQCSFHEAEIKLADYVP